jgi:hypothetical protein
MSSQKNATEHIPCFHNEKVDNADFECEKNTVADVVLPRQSIQGDTIDKLIEEQRSRNAEVQPHETLGTQSVRQDLSGVTGHDARLDVVEDTVEEDGDDESLSETVRRRDIVSCRDDSEDVEHNKGTDRGNEVDWATTEFVDEEGEEEVLAQRQSLHTAIDTKLRLGIRHANSVHHVF